MIVRSQLIPKAILHKWNIFILFQMVFRISPGKILRDSKVFVKMGNVCNAQNAIQQQYLCLIQWLEFLDKIQILSNTEVCFYRREITLTVQKYRLMRILQYQVLRWWVKIDIQKKDCHTIKYTNNNFKRISILLVNQDATCTNQCLFSFALWQAHVAMWITILFLAIKTMLTPCSPHSHSQAHVRFWTRQTSNRMSYWGRANPLAINGPPSCRSSAGHTHTSATLPVLL